MKVAQLLEPGPFRGQRLHICRPWPRAAGAEGKNPREVGLDHKGFRMECEATVLVFYLESGEPDRTGFVVGLGN